MKKNMQTVVAKYTAKKCKTRMDLLMLKNKLKGVLISFSLLKVAH